jgi:hypothetical protein
MRLERVLITEKEIPKKKIRIALEDFNLNHISLSLSCSSSLPGLTFPGP